MPRVPYRYSQSNIPALLARQGDIEAETADRRASIWANLVGTVGQQIGNALQDRQMAEATKKAHAVERNQTAQVEGALAQSKLPDADPDAIEASLDPTLRARFRESWGKAEESAAKRRKLAAEAQAADLDYMGDLAAEVESYKDGPDGGLSAAQIALAHAKKEGVQGVERFEQTLSENPGALPELLVRVKASSPKWQKIALEKEKAAREADDLKLRQTREQRELEAAKGLAADRTADNARQEKTLAETIRHNQSDEALAREKMKAGEQPKPGRGVTSGDVNRITEMDQGISEARVLRNVLSGNNATGIAAEAGTYVPDWVTSVTGWGADSKSKNATIQLVKQVIGKGLEGGVLRKEDEVKYQKMLPTLADSAAVVKAKLDNLERAISDKRTSHLENLSAAGYDVSRFSKERAAPEAPAAGGPQIGERRVINGKLGEWDGKGWKPVR